MKKPRKMKATTFLEKYQDKIYSTRKKRAGDVPNRIRIFKRKELIQPRMNALDYNRVLNKMYDYLRDYSRKLGGENLKVIDNAQKTIGSRNGSDVEKIIQDHLIHDIYSMYFRNKEEGDITIIPQFNETKFRLLEKVTDSIMQIVTEGNYINSFFFTRTVSQFIYRLLVELQETDPEKAESIIAALNAGPDSFGNSDDLDAAQKLENILNKGSVGEALKEALRDAEKQASKLSDFSKDVGKDPSEIEKINAYEQVLDRMKAIVLSRQKMTQVLKFIMETSVNYFTKHYVEHEESIFDAEEILEVLDMEFLVDPFKKFCFQDVGTIERTYKGKFDVYIDASGSMGNSISANSDLVIAKAVVIRLMRMNLIKNVYFFDTRVSGPYNTELQVLQFHSGGGTDFEKVAQHCIKENNNALVITDGCDSLRTYSSKIFWFGVGGSRLNSSLHEKYYNNKQVVEYDDRSGTIRYVGV